MEYLLVAIALLAVPFILPIVLWVAVARLRARLLLLERVIEGQRTTMDRLVQALGEQARRPGDAAGSVASGTPVRHAEAAPPDAAFTTQHPEPGHRLAQIEPALHDTAPPPSPPAPRPSPPPPASRPAAGGIPPPGPPPSVPSPSVPSPRPGATLPREGVAAPSGGPPPAPPPRREAPPFDWESLIGVKLFSAIAGVALVMAAVFFLRYSVQQDWLQPPVRVFIGLAVAVALLVVCERKAARQYPATANALDAAAIAILFATVFAAHALWSLVPAPVAFVLLAAVTGLAVLLSIRRESLFIAVLGLLGGFATPALLSTGENRPVPLFAYLVLLNVGLAWVAYRQAWPALTLLTVLLTSAYQWVWVLRFLSANELSLAIGIFAVFPVVSVTALLLGRQYRLAPGGDEGMFGQSVMLSAALPLVFVLYLSAVPAYGARPATLFGFLLLVDAGLLAVAAVLRQHPLHAVGALVTLLVWGVWLTSGYDAGSRDLAIGFTSAFVALYLSAPAILSRVSRSPLPEPVATVSVVAAPALLFVFAGMAALEPPDAPIWRLFGPLLILVVVCAWRADALGRGLVFFVASFLAIAAQAAWSAAHLEPGRVGAAVSVYASFGLVASVVPVLARRAGRPLQPERGGAIVLLASLGLLVFLSRGGVAPAALWGFALLVAILNAGIFIESAATRAPGLAHAGSLLSWMVLAVWWTEAAGAVGVLSSLGVVTGLTLVTLGGHAWASRALGVTGPRGREVWTPPFGRGPALAFTGHLFLLVFATNREWSLPPWPLFGALLVMTLGTTACAVFLRSGALQVAGAGAAALVIAFWTAAAAVMPWTAIGLGASGALSLMMLGLLAAGPGSRVPGARDAALLAIFGSEVTAILASAAEGPPPFAALLGMHLANLAVALALGVRAGRPAVSLPAVAIAWIALLEWQLGHDAAAAWLQILLLSAGFYALFTANALLAGPRVPHRREPWIAALVAGAMTFLAAGQALTAGGFRWMIGALPLGQGLVTAALLHALLRLEPAGARDLTRLALVSAAALGFVTVAIPLQLQHQWITIGWALEAAALAWLYRRVPHRGLLLACMALMAVVFVRLAMNPSVWTYEPRGALRILNWYLYTYGTAAVSMLAAAWYLSKTPDRLAAGLPRASHLLPAGATVLLFLLLNIEIADYYSTGPDIIFRFGATVSQDLTYTIGWLVFGMLLLAAGLYLQNRAARIAAVALIAVTTFKCFLYDLGSLEGLYRVASFVGLAAALALVSLALQKYVLARPGASS